MWWREKIQEVEIREHQWRASVLDIFSTWNVYCARHSAICLVYICQKRKKPSRLVPCLYFYYVPLGWCWWDNTPLVVVFSNQTLFWIRSVGIVARLWEWELESHVMAFGSHLLCTFLSFRFCIYDLSLTIITANICWKLTLCWAVMLYNCQLCKYQSWVWTQASGPRTHIISASSLCTEALKAPDMIDIQQTVILLIIII